MVNRLLTERFKASFPNVNDIVQSIDALKDYDEWKQLTLANRDDESDEEEELPQSWAEIKKLDNPEKELEDEELAILNAVAAENAVIALV